MPVSLFSGESKCAYSFAETSFIYDTINILPWGNSQNENGERHLVIGLAIWNELIDWIDDFLN